MNIIGIFYLERDIHLHKNYSMNYIQFSGLIRENQVKSITTYKLQGFVRRYLDLFITYS